MRRGKASERRETRRARERRAESRGVRTSSKMERAGCGSCDGVSLTRREKLVCGGRPLPLTWTSEIPDVYYHSG